MTEKQKASRWTTSAAILIVGGLFATGARVVLAVLKPPAPINLTALVTVPAAFPNPIGIDFQDTSGTLLATVNYPSGSPNNFDQINPVTGTLTPFSTVVVKIDK